VKPKELLVTVPLILVALSAACGKEEELERETLEPSPLPVTAVPARVDTLFEVIESTGRVASARTQDLTAQLQGEVVQAPQYEGEMFSDGEVIFRIAAGEQAANLSSASSAYRNALAIYEFECDNYRGDLTEEVRRMLRETTGLEAASAALARAQTQYGNAAVSAGFDGTIADINVREGMMVYPGTRLGTLIDPNQLQVNVDLDERQLARCSPGQRVYVTVPSLNDTTVIGNVRSVSPTIDPGLRAGGVVIDVPRLTNLRPGATARVEVVVGVYPDQLVIPQEAVLIRDNRDMVFVVLEDHADWRYVTLGAFGRGLVSVLDGVEEGEMVITSGHYSLAHGAPVAVVN
jgi:RND family efflux transporter MFP subunit